MFSSNCGGSQTKEIKYEDKSVNILQTCCSFIFLLGAMVSSYSHNWISIGLPDCNKKVKAPLTHN